MGISHLAVADYGCTYEVWDGDIDGEEVRAHLVRLAEDAHWPPGVLNLVDLSTVGVISVPDPDLVALLREGTVLEQELRTALVVRAEFLGENAPAYDDAARATGVTAFTDVSSACEHLALPLDVSLRFMELLRSTLGQA
jgi:hypothetical protein